MSSRLDVQVSLFRSVSNSSDPAKTINLLDWLKGDQKLDIRVKDLRNLSDPEEQKRKKLTLPAITPSGTFSTRKNDSLLQHSGLICLDIDFEQNPDMDDFDQVKEQLSQLRYIAYCGLSVRAQGYYALVAIDKPEQHVDVFNYLRDDFDRAGLVIDNTPDVARLRIYSYDPDPYFNEYASTVKYSPKIISLPTQVEPEPAPPASPPVRTSPYAITAEDYKTSSFTETSWDQVEQLADKIEASGIDIAPTYREYFKVGMALINEFGSGFDVEDTLRKIFRQSPKFKEHDFNQHFKEWSRNKRSNLSASTLFYQAKHYGVYLKDEPHYIPDTRQAIPKQDPLLNENGYPASWDDVDPPEPGSAEYLESLLAAISDLDDGDTITLTGLELTYLGLR